MQAVIVYILVAGAVFYLGRKTYRQFFSKKHHCDSCAFSPKTPSNPQP